MSMGALLTHCPQIVKTNAGPEPSLNDLILNYYLSHGIKGHAAYDCRDKYLKALGERFEVSYRGAAS